MTCEPGNFAYGTYREAIRTDGRRKPCPGSAVSLAIEASGDIIIMYGIIMSVNDGNQSRATWPPHTAPPASHPVLQAA